MCMRVQKAFCEPQSTDWIAKFMAFFICSEIISLGLNSFVNKFISKGVVWDTLFIYGILFYYVFYICLTVKFRLNKGVLIFLCFLTFCVIGLVFNPGNVGLIPEYDYSLLFLGALLFFLSQQMFKIDEIYKFFIPIYWIAIFCGLIHFLTVERNVSLVASWVSDMAAGYALLPVTLFAIDYAFFNKKAIPWAFVGVITMFLCGSRGPVVVAAMFLFVDVVRYSKKLYQKIIFSVLIVVSIVVSQMGIHLLWLSSLDEFLKNKGLAIASLQKVLYYTDVSNGRADIHSSLIQYVIDRPMAVNGIYYDRTFSGFYAHNLFVEILVDFGLIIGGVMCVYLVVSSVKMVMSCMRKNEQTLSVILIIMFSVIGKLLFSSSYLHEPLFWFFIGLFYNCNSSDSVRYEK